MRRPAALVAVLGVLAAGCGGNDGPTAATNVETRASKPTTPAGFTVRTVKDEGFAIALPRQWRSLNARQALASDSLQEFQKSNPTLKSQLQALAAPDSPLKLLAVAPVDKSGFLTNLNVIVTQLPSGLDFEDWTKTELAQIKNVPTVKDVQQEVTELAPGQTLHLTYKASFNRASGPYDVIVNQWLVKKDEFLYILTYTTSPALQAKLRQTFDDSAHTFELTD